MAGRPMIDTSLGNGTETSPVPSPESSPTSARPRRHSGGLGKKGRRSSKEDGGRVAPEAKDAARSARVASSVYEASSLADDEGQTEDGEFLKLDTGMRVHINSG